METFHIIIISKGRPVNLENNKGQKLSQWFIAGKTLTEEKLEKRFQPIKWYINGQSFTTKKPFKATTATILNRECIIISHKQGYRNWCMEAPIYCDEPFYGDCIVLFTTVNSSAELNIIVELIKRSINALDRKDLGNLVDKFEVDYC